MQGLANDPPLDAKSLATMIVQEAILANASLPDVVLTPADIDKQELFDDEGDDKKNVKAYEDLDIMFGLVRLPLALPLAWRES